MRLQKQLGKKVGDKVYPKYVVVIPPKLIEESGFKEGDELEGEAKKGEVKLKKRI